MPSTKTSPRSSLAMLELVQSGLDSTRFKKNRVGFFAEIGSRLNRKPITPDEWQEEVLASEARFKIINASRQIGKSTVIAGLCVHRAEFDPGCKVIILAPTEKQAKIAFAKVARFYLAWAGKAISKDAYRLRQEHEPKKMSVVFSNGSEIQAMPATPNTTRGFEADLLVIDEAAYVMDEAYDSIYPAISTSGGDLVLASTPHGKVGFFYRAWAKERGWDCHRVPIERCPRADLEFVEAARFNRGDSYVDQEFRCSFEEAEGQVFSDHLIDAAIRMDIEPLFPEYDTGRPGVNHKEELVEEENGEEDLITTLWNEF